MIQKENGNIKIRTDDLLEGMLKKYSHLPDVGW
jgi:hypothetical protein